jgi:hypothetical protein
MAFTTETTRSPGHSVIDYVTIIGFAAMVFIALAMALVSYEPPGRSASRPVVRSREGSSYVPADAVRTVTIFYLVDSQEKADIVHLAEQDIASIHLRAYTPNPRSYAIFVANTREEGEWYEKMAALAAVELALTESPFSFVDMREPKVAP